MKIVTCHRNYVTLNLNKILQVFTIKFSKNNPKRRKVLFVDKDFFTFYYWLSTDAQRTEVLS